MLRPSNLAFNDVWLKENNKLNIRAGYETPLISLAIPLRDFAYTAFLQVTSGSTVQVWALASSREEHNQTQARLFAGAVDRLSNIPKQVLQVSLSSCRLFPRHECFHKQTLLYLQQENNQIQWFSVET